MIEIKNNNLMIDGLAAVDLAKEFGTALFVYSEEEILSRINELKASFLDKYENTRVAYAAKAFFPLAMSKLIEREGLCVDVVSDGELYTAIKADFPAEKIELNGNNKSRKEIEMAVDYGIGRIIVDGLQELKLIESICKEKNKRMSILYRITPGIESNTHRYISTATVDSKFGIPLNEDVIFPAINDAMNSEYLDFLGFHFHVGSQLFDSSSHLRALEIVLKLIKESKERFDFECKEINIGGGFAVNYLEDDQKKPFSYFLDPIMERVNDFFAEIGYTRPEIVIEPGRSLVAEASLTLYEAGSIKNIEGIRKYVSINGGMTDNIRPALYEAKYNAVIADRASDKREEFVSIAGKCCESSDIIIYDIKMPPIKQGDIIAVFTTGAYGYSMASNYNKHRKPAVVLVSNGKAELIIKRESYDDLLANELIPESLK